MSADRVMQNPNNSLTEKPLDQEKSASVEQQVLAPRSKSPLKTFNKQLDFRVDDMRYIKSLLAGKDPARQELRRQNAQKKQAMIEKKLQRMATNHEVASSLEESKSSSGVSDLGSSTSSYEDSQ